MIFVLQDRIAREIPSNAFRSEIQQMKYQVTRLGVIYSRRLRARLQSDIAKVCFKECQFF